MLIYRSFCYSRWQTCRIIILLVSTLLIVSCDSKNNEVKHDLDDLISIPKTTEQNSRVNKENTFNFGFDLRASPQEDARQYLPFLNYLEKETGYRFKFHFTSKAHNIVDELGKNHVQFAAIGATSLILANRQYGVIPVVRGLNLQNKAEYQSFFVVLPSSKIQHLADISGKHFAFGSRSSTQGYLIPRIVLSKSEIELESFASITFTGSHVNCANSVISGRKDVCAMQDTMARSMVKQGLLRTIHTSDYYPSSGIAANKDVPKEVLKKVRKALLDFKPKGKDMVDLYNWDKTEMPLGFVEANMSDYDDLYKWSVSFNFISP